MMTKLRSGTIIWKNEKGQLHRLDGPAVEYDDNTTNMWWIDGKEYENIHRLFHWMLEKMICANQL